jgi:hypothetical protein
MATKKKAKTPRFRTQPSRADQIADQIESRANVLEQQVAEMRAIVKLLRGED